MKNSQLIQESVRMGKVCEPQTLAMASKVRELRLQGKEVYSLTLGEPDFATPEYIRLAAEKALKNPLYHHYPPIVGLSELRESVVAFMKRHYELTYKNENVLVSTGAKQSLANIFLGLFNPNDELLLPAPYWVSYMSLAQLADVKVKIIPTNFATGFKITPEQLAQSLSVNTKAFLFNNPCNPSGMVYNAQEVAALANVLAQYPDVLIITDDIYSLLSYEAVPPNLASFHNLIERTIIVNGVSKAFAMTGWRIGFIAAPLAVVKICEKVQGQFTSGANAVAQVAAAAALNAELTETYKMRDEFRVRRDLGVRLFQELMPKVNLPIPQGAFFFFPDFTHYIGAQLPNQTVVRNADDLASYLLDYAGVATVPCEGFGSPNNLRLSYACDSATLEKALRKMAQALNNLN